MINVLLLGNTNSLSMEIYLQQLANHLTKMPGLTVQTLPFSRFLPGKLGATCRSIRTYLFNPLYLRAKCQPSVYDVAHITDHSDSQLIKYLDADRTVATCHDLMVFNMVAGNIQTKESDRLPDATSLKRTMKRIDHIKRARKIIAVSENTKRDLMTLLGLESSRIEVIYSGLNHSFKPYVPEIRRQSRRKLGLENNKILLHVGSNAFYKNVTGILEALAVNREYNQKNKVVFLKVGEELSPGQKELIAKHGLTSQVRYYGQANTFEELMDLYNLADLFVFPSLYEGFGWPPLEAMACGIPVLASQGGALKEVLEDAAYIINPLDNNKMALGIIKCLEDQELRNCLVRRGRNNISRFNWNIAAEKTSKIYDMIANIYHD